MDNWILKQAQIIPNRIAVEDGNKKLTFAELLASVEQISGQLAAIGAFKGQRIAIMTTNCIYGYQMALASLGSNQTIVWINWRLADDEIKRQLADSNPSICLVDDVLWRKSFENHSQFLKFSDVIKTAAKPIELTNEFDFDDTASIMYTSGTTGNPKGVLQTFHNHFASAISSALNLGISSHDEWVCAVPIFHISGFSIMLRGLIYGMCVRLVPKFYPIEIDQILKYEPVTTISVVPYMLKKLLDLRDKDSQGYNSKFRCLLLGGGAIDKQTLIRCQKFNMPVVQSYGMTETCSQIIALNYSDAGQRIGSVGKPLFLTQLKLSKVSNEILIKTPALTPGYLNRPQALQKKKDADGWYHTGDIGHFDKDGFCLSMAELMT